MNIFVLGFIATILGVLSFLNIVYNIELSGNTHNFSYKALILSLLSNLLWLIYGFKKRDKSITIMGIINMILNLYIIYKKNVKHVYL
tara:strand:+ start:2535 stop:2795 length:261 start_codon:yes stop_codon:yes gene_type:complete